MITVDLLFVFTFTGGLCLILAVGELIFKAAYRFIKGFRGLIDRFAGSLPDYWED